MIQNADGFSLFLMLPVIGDLSPSTPLVHLYSRGHERSEGNTYRILEDPWSENPVYGVNIKAPRLDDRYLGFC